MALLTRGVYSVSAQVDFAKALAHAVYDSFGSDPLTLAQVRIFLPTRRACIALREQFLNLSGGKPLLLPSLIPLGDVEADEIALGLFSSQPNVTLELFQPTAAAMKRTLTLARLVQAFHAQAFPQEAGFDHAVRLAQELIHFLDEAEREEIPLAGLGNLAPQEFAEHWQQVTTFLSVLAEHYQPLAKEEKLISSVERRNTLLSLLAAQWEKSPPQTPIMIAGTTGTNPAVARLMKAAARLPRGSVVLPGLDRHMSDEAWERINDTHAQYALKKLLERMGITRAGVTPLAGQGGCSPERIALLSQALLPPEATASWKAGDIDVRKALENVEYIECETTEEEAQVISLMLRDALEVPGKTAALVTHDRTLARRVSALMQRFGVTLDDSAGKPLAQTEAGAFFNLVTDVAQSRMAPVPLLALLKHPVAHVGLAAADCRRLARIIERFSLRGERPQDIQEMCAKIAAANHAELIEACALLKKLSAHFSPLFDLLNKSTAIPLPEFFRRHVECAEQLATDAEGKIALWAATGGGALLEYTEEAMAQDDSTLSIAPGAYAATNGALMSDITWRPAWGTHPRLHILSPMEARLQSFDRIILAGLNEASWPPAADADPWMSRPMRAAFGLPAPEQKISQAAHDFLMQWHAGELFLTRSAKSGGAAAIESRWISRLLTLTEATKNPLPARPWKQWARELQQAEVIPSAERPSPRPPVNARPQALSVTEVETLLRDPYAIYAKHLLHLRKLDPIDREADARDFGNLVHLAIEDCAAHLPEDVNDMQAALLQSGQRIFAPIKARKAQYTLWWARFERIAEWLAQQEMLRRPGLGAVIPELKGRLNIDGMTLKARADRIETTAGFATIVDYKTGSLPETKHIKSGYACQLPLEAVMLEQGGFPGVSGEVAALEYWQLKGAADGGEIKNIAAKDLAIDTLKQSALDGVKALFARYAQEMQAYAACPILDERPKYNDYEHLERLDEWSGQ